MDLSLKTFKQEKSTQHRPAENVCQLHVRRIDTYSSQNQSVMQGKLRFVFDEEFGQIIQIDLDQVVVLSMRFSQRFLRHVAMAQVAGLSNLQFENGRLMNILLVITTNEVVLCCLELLLEVVSTQLNQPQSARQDVCPLQQTCINKIPIVSLKYQQYGQLKQRLRVLLTCTRSILCH
eukprot:m.33803 g.33803  ORF g.33803 m.33803 type:complete len:177 (+) comp12259_c0_seq1:946-1476(+)